MTFFACDNLRAVTSGRWLRRPADGVDLVGVGTDTRADLAGRIFVAIVGARFDGHDFLGQAAEAGAALAIVERRRPLGALPRQFGVLLVDDTRRALAQLALAYRRTLRGTKVVAVTGSCGKTTTKHMIHAVLATTHQGTAAIKSFNNDIGVPLTILNARPSDRYLVVEIGSNAPGEVSQLGNIAEPDIAVITNIGRSHLQGFGSLEGVAREKGSLLACLCAKATAILHADAPLLAPYAKPVQSVITFGESDHADLRLTDRGRCGDGYFFEVNGRVRFDLALPGAHNALNALAAVAVGRRFSVPDADISRALGSLAPAPMRMAVQTVGRVVIYNDAYNANPDSTAAALDTFIEAAGQAKRRIVVLGDMLELGDDAAPLHREIGRRLIDVDSRRSIHHAVLIGPLATHIADAVARVWPESRYTHLPALNDGAIDDIIGMLRPGDAILVKASRELRLERLVDAVHAHAGSAPVGAAASSQTPGRARRARRNLRTKPCST